MPTQTGELGVTDSVTLSLTRSHLLLPQRGIQAEERTPEERGGSAFWQKTGGTPTWHKSC